MMNPGTTFYRSTVSWLNPAENTHIGWHIDSVYDVLKVMVFLTDVELENGPMYFLKKTNTSTHDTVNRFKHSVFLWKPSKEKAPRISDMYHELVHDPSPAGLEKKTIIKVGDDTFERVAATGKRGDAILFETSAFHSGNRALETRKTVILSTPNEISTPKNIFLSYIGYPRK
jgi:ectoine hydroxylase-related dioxygenase (phytanoyl-CoA dioxygenase family)